MLRMPRFERRRVLHDENEHLHLTTRCRATPRFHQVQRQAAVASTVHLRYQQERNRYQRHPRDQKTFVAGSRPPTRTPVRSRRSAGHHHRQRAQTVADAPSTYPR